MNPWSRASREGLITGSVASVTSTIALALAGRREIGRPAAPVNAVSHWFWDRESLAADKPTARHTVVGYLVHHGASVFWGILHARAWGMHARNKGLGPALAGAAGASAMACLVDMKLTPRRLTPGFEHRLSKRSLTLTYVSFGIGLALASMLLKPREAPGARRPRAGQPPPPIPAS